MTAATVYTDRAIVTRTARATLPAGESGIILEKLPSNLIDASVHVRGQGVAATILDVSTAITYTAQTDPATQPRVKTLQDDIKTIDKTLRALTDRDNNLQWQQNLVGKIENAIAAPPTKDTPASHPDIDDMQKLLAFSLENRAALALERQQLADEINDTKDKRAALQNQLNEILQGGATARKSHKTVTIRVRAANPGDLDLTIDYTITAASWTPSYDVRLRAAPREVELTYYGNVRQSSGEDWDAIALTLSTARPGLGGAAPEARPWYVDVYAPPPPPRQQAPAGSAGSVNYYATTGQNRSLNIGSGAMGNAVALRGSGAYILGEGGNRVTDGVALNNDAMFKNFVTSDNGTGFIAPQPPPSIAAANATASVANATTSASFKIAAPTSIPSDNTPQKVSITTAALAAKLQYQALPAMQETAYLSAYVDNTTDYPLIAGNTHVFLDDAYVTTSTIKTIMPTERFQLALGADEGIAIKRRVVNRYTENTGLTGKGRRVTYENLITITNKKKTPERVVFKETLPLSRNEKIVLTQTAPAERDTGTPEKPGREVTREENNTLVWRIDMKPGEKREIPIKFALDYPGDIQVTGLE
ncbi:MAG: mucoidy inhibitor MuiA family protein [Opitutaceae bacterium]|nr:mucoidy inhibitor MuiA family protein [Opitutaceae bacterium]